MNPKLAFCASGPSWPELSADIEVLEGETCHGYANGCKCEVCLERTKEFATDFEASSWEKQEMHRLGEEGYFYAGIEDGAQRMDHLHRPEVPVETAERIAVRAVERHALKLGLPCDRDKARALLDRHGSYADALQALNRLADDREAA